MSIGRLRASASPVAFENAAVALRLHPEAEEELFHEAAYYDDARLGLGDEFLEHVYRWFDVILDAPMLGRVGSAHPNPTRRYDASCWIGSRTRLRIK